MIRFRCLLRLDCGFLLTSLLFPEILDLPEFPVLPEIPDPSEALLLLPASPMQVVQAHIMREDSVYMRDYVLNEKGDIKELCFNNVDQRISEHEYPSN